MASHGVPLLVISLCVYAGVSSEVKHRNCDSLNNCLDYAMNKIHASERYSLFESLWFDAINGTNNSYVITTSDPRNFTELAKKATELFNTHYLIWKIAPGLNVKVFKKTEDQFGMSVLKDVYPLKNEGRTFGIGKRRIMMAMLPVMYKLGVITTLLIVLTVITLKGVTIGVVLLMLSFGGIVSKLKTAHGHWAPEGLQKDVHIHVHTGSKPEHVYHSAPSYSAGWDRGEPAEEDAVTAHASSSTTPPPWSYLPPFINY